MIKSMVLFFSFVALLAIPAVYQVQCPTCHGTGKIEVQTIGLDNVKLDGFNAMVVNVVRLGCGLYAVYTINVTLAVSNVAKVPINATFMVTSSDRDTGVAYYKYPLEFEIPAGSSGFLVAGQVPSKMYVGAGGKLPVLAFSVVLFGASNVTVFIPCPDCGGRGTVPLLKSAVMGSGTPIGGG